MFKEPRTSTTDSRNLSSKTTPVFDCVETSYRKQKKNLKRKELSEKLLSQKRERQLTYLTESSDSW